MNVSSYMYVCGPVHTLCSRRSEDMKSEIIESVVGTHPGFSVGIAYGFQKVHPKPQLRKPQSLCNILKNPHADLIGSCSIFSVIFLGL